MAFLTEKLISASGAVGEETDPDFNLVTALFHFGGSNGAQNYTFLDSSSNSFSVTQAGNTTQGTFSPFSAEDGKWSIDAASGQSFVDVTNTSGDFQWGTGAFTIEGFVFMAGPNSVYGPVFVDERPASTNGAYVYLAIDSSQRLVMSVEGGSYYVRTTGDIRSDRIGKWTHFAFVRSSTSTNQSFLFWNGNKVATGTIPTNFNATTVSRLGMIKYVTASNNRLNYYSNFRFLKGTALYTGSTYTIPTAPLTNITNTKLLTLQSNRFVDNSNNSNNSFTGNGSTTAIVPFSPFAPSAAYDPAVNGGSGYFDGSGDYLDVGSSNATQLGSGNFTVDFWIKTTDTSFNIANPDSATGSSYWGLLVQSGDLRWNDSYAVSNKWVVDGAGILDDAWHHVAIVRNSGTIAVYYDGTSQSVQSGSFSDSTDYSGSDGLRIGSGNLSAFNGYLSSFRTVSGTAVYTSAFTPPTAPSTAITNTKLLLNFTNAAIFDQTGKTNVETVGNAQLDTSIKKFGTASAEFDGNGDRLVLSNKDLAPVGTQSFTIECFIYVNANKNYNGIYSAGFGIQMYVNSSGKLQCWLGNSSGSFFVNGLQSTTIIPTSTWRHIALVRDSSANTLTWFVEGLEKGQQTSVTDSVANLTTYSHTIGSYESGTYSMNGYIDEFRITNKARYTSNFTAPTKEFANR